MAARSMRHCCVRMATQTELKLKSWAERQHGNVESGAAAHHGVPLAA